ncbi:hypothetical protein TVNIR_2796 [Thioalkalivibrio nitratireducens DSM 14787]|uniref:Uncharacterized protein n=1 Tax=Thioalkalivibrio nitratireducens (strain DSM 14787 / UNIQEM 213 / ALEN2) TaxID=1255043 RepID=L0DXX7_THIND|nr:hypothetical protein TVNIR_2796 [Thioalkalivibrio nitratireducens DSM 14787]
MRARDCECFLPPPASGANPPGADFDGRTRARGRGRMPGVKGERG